MRYLKSVLNVQGRDQIVLWDDSTVPTCFKLKSYFLKVSMIDCICILLIDVINYFLKVSMIVCIIVGTAY
jgi:hypothetical protein